MRTYSTEIDRPDGAYDGPIVTAADWDEAKITASEFGCRVTGELCFESDVSGNILLVGTGILGENTRASDLDHLFPGTAD